jgi:hypothetical protein
MSLVVANCSTKAIKIVSDTRLTCPNARLPLGHLEGALKILLLSSEVGFAFAGNYEIALEALEIVTNTPSHKSNLDSLVSLLLDKNIQCNDATDFLAFSVKPSLRLCKITRGSVLEGANQYWIGDHEAFNCYQQNFVSSMAMVSEPLRQSSDCIHVEMDMAMQEVIESCLIQTVGDFLVPASSDRDGLRCRLSQNLVKHRQNNRLLSPPSGHNKWRALILPKLQRS